MLVTLAEMALASGLGAELEPYSDSGTDASEDMQQVSLAALLFGEDQGRYLVALGSRLNLKERAQAAGTDAIYVGTVGFRDQQGREGILIEAVADVFIALDDLRRAHECFLPDLMGADGALA